MSPISIIVLHMLAGTSIILSPKINEFFNYLVYYRSNIIDG